MLLLHGRARLHCNNIANGKNTHCDVVVRSGRDSVVVAVSSCLLCFYQQEQVEQRANHVLYTLLSRIMINAFKGKN